MKIEWHCIYISKHATGNSIHNYFKNYYKMNSRLITLTNNGYKDITDNMLFSLRKIGIINKMTPKEFYSKLRKEVFKLRSSIIEHRH